MKVAPVPAQGLAQHLGQHRSNRQRQGQGRQYQRAPATRARGWQQVEVEGEGQQQHSADHEVGRGREHQLDARDPCPQAPAAIGGQQCRDQCDQYGQHRRAAGQGQRCADLLADGLAHRNAQPVRLAQIAFGQARQVVAVLQPQRLVKAIFGAHLGEHLGRWHGIRPSQDRQRSIPTAVLHAEERQAGRRPQHDHAVAQAAQQRCQQFHGCSLASHTLVNRGTLCEPSNTTPPTAALR